ALAYVKNVFRGVLVDLPALQEASLEGEVARELDQRLERLAHGVGNLRPVGRTRVLVGLDEHRDLQNPALLGLLRERTPRRGHPEHAVGHRGRGTENARQCKKLAPVHLSGPGLFRQRLDLARHAIPVAFEELHRRTPIAPTAFGFTVAFRIPFILSKHGLRSASLHRRVVSDWRDCDKYDANLMVYGEFVAFTRCKRRLSAQPNANVSQ